MSAPAPLHTEQVHGLAVLRRRPVHADADTPTVVLVHGAMDRAASFGRTMRRLGDVDVIAYDRRGYAGSPVRGEGRIADHAEDLATVIDWAGRGPVTVVGHSLGGTVAVALASGRPDLVRSLMAFESPFPLLDDSFDEVGGGAVAIGLRDGAAAGAEHFYRLMVGDQVWSRLRDRDRAARRAEGEALMSELIDLRDRSRAVDPRGIGVPVLVGSGGLSGARLRASAEQLHAALPGSGRLVIDTAGHGAHLTHPDEFARCCRVAADPAGWHDRSATATAGGSDGAA